MGTNKDKRICIQRHLTIMSTLGGMINAAIDLEVQSFNEELDLEVRHTHRWDIRTLQDPISRGSRCELKEEP